MEPEFWYICPIWFIPAFIMWACLNGLCDHYYLADRLAKRYGWSKQRVQKWQERITGFISLGGTLVVIIAISVAVGFDLLNWEWYSVPQ